MLVGLIRLKECVCVGGLFCLGLFIGGSVFNFGIGCCGCCGKNGNVNVELGIGWVLW